MKSSLLEREEDRLSAAGLVSRLTFSWVSPLVSKGYKKRLTQEDLEVIPEVYEVEKNEEALLRNWKDVKR